MNKIFGLMALICFVILLVSSFLDILFPLTVVGSVAQFVPQRGKIRLWNWLAGTDQATSERLETVLTTNVYGYDQDEIDAWIQQFSGEESDRDLIWMNHLLFVPMDRPVYTTSPAFDFEWQPETPVLRPKFVCAPLIVGGTTYQTDYFGSDNRPNEWEHTGIDFGTNHQVGLPVITPMEGVVVFSGEYGGWGNTVIIQNSVYQVWLTHAIDFNVEVGQSVHAGDVVMFNGGQPGSIGAGSSTGAHLHFEVRYCEEIVAKSPECEIVNPNSTMLPGQQEVCFWNAQVTAPEKNWHPYINQR